MMDNLNSAHTLHTLDIGNKIYVLAQEQNNKLIQKNRCFFLSHYSLYAPYVVSCNSSRISPLKI